MLRTARVGVVTVLILLLASAGEGAGDSPPEVQNLRFLDPEDLAWDPAPSADAYNVYRGSSPAALVCLLAGVVGTGAADREPPAPGAVLYYAVAAVAGGVEGTLGSDSADNPRRSPRPCPTLPAPRLDLLNPNGPRPDGVVQGVEPPRNPSVAPFRVGRTTLAGVYLHTGEFWIRALDLEIQGRGLHWRHERTYRSQISHDGPHGRNWIHNYDRRVVPTERSLLYLDGSGRQDEYMLNGSFYQPLEPGLYNRIHFEPDGSPTLRERDGTLYRHFPLDGNPAQGLLSAVEDRFGNRIQLLYHPNGLLSSALDTLGRTIVYTYDLQGRLTQITDFSGRTLHYEYDAEGNLIHATGPAVTGTPTGNDFPDGKTTTYTYSSGTGSPGLDHDLLQIVLPGDPAPLVTNTYNAADELETQTVGGTNGRNVGAGGSLVYSILALGGGMGETRVVDRNGNRASFVHDLLGHRVGQIDLTNRELRPGEPDYAAAYFYDSTGEIIQVTHPEGNATVYVYHTGSPDRLQRGNLLELHRFPDPARGGDQEALSWRFDYEPVYNQVRSVCDPRGRDPSFTPTVDPESTGCERYTTTVRFDYEEACDFARLGAQLGFTPAAAQALLANAGMCGEAAGDLNGDGTTHQAGGNVIRIERPAVHLVAGSNQAAVEGDPLQEAASLFSYNDFGQLIRATDPEGNVDEYAYHPEADPDGDGVLSTSSRELDPFTGGYLKEVALDTSSAPGRDSGTDPAPATVRSLLFYDPAGNLTRAVNGRGIETAYSVNQLDQVVRIVRAAAHGLLTPDPPEPEALTDFQYEEQIVYDLRDNVALRQVEDRGDTSDTGGFVDYSYVYDILDDLVGATEEIGAGASRVTAYRYDANQNLVEVRRPDGNLHSRAYDERDLLLQATRGAGGPSGGVPSVTTYHHDGNANLVESVDASDTDGSAANNSGRGGGGDRTRYLYDGFDRLVSIVDSVGSQSVYQYDPANNLVRLSRFGTVGGRSPTSDGAPTLPVSSGGVIQAANLANPTLLSAVATHYDEINRPFQVDRALFFNSVPTLRPPDVADGAADLGKGDLTPADSCDVPGVPAPPSGHLGCVSARSEYDRNSRLTFVVEDDGDTWRFGYDGADRRILSLDPEGNATEYAYDDRDNLIERRETDVAQVAGLADEVFLTTNFYDSLDRLVRRVDNLGRTWDYRFDSRDNLVAMSDPRGPAGSSISRRAFAPGPLTVNTTNAFGNIALFSYDGANRRILEEIVLTASGSGDGVHIGATLEGVRSATPTPDLSQGGGDGRIALRYEWDANSRPAALTDDNGNQTRYAYDNLDRRVEETRGVCAPPALADRCDPPTGLTYQYDPDDNLVRRTDESGSARTCAFDAVNRPLSCTISRGPGVVGTTAATYQYDGLSRLVLATDNNHPLDVTDDSAVVLAYDSLDRIIEEFQRIGARQRAVSSAWRAEGLRSSLTYPDGRILDFRYDALDRLVTVADRSGGAPIADYDYLGPWRVARRSHPLNATRLTFLDDLGLADTGYDGARRPLRMRHLRFDGSLVVGFQYAYDRASNRTLGEKLHAPGDSELYAYDSQSRLVRFERGTLNPARDAILVPSPRVPLHRNWGLDGAGNWRQVDTETRRHSSFNEIVQRTDRLVIDLLSDDNGNVTDDGSFLLRWDYLNRLRSVVRRSDGAVLAAYSYDAAGRRIRKVVSNSGIFDGSTDFWLDGWREVEEHDGADVLVQQFVNGRPGDGPLAVDQNLDRSGGATDQTDRRLLYHADALASTFALTDARGAVIEGYQYDAYGRPTFYTAGFNRVVEFGGDDVIRTGGASLLFNPYLFAGLRLDAETGLHRIPDRYLDYQLGRTLSRDPRGMWGGAEDLGNPYAFAAGNPLSRVSSMREGLPLLARIVEPQGRPWAVDLSRPPKPLPPPKPMDNLIWPRRLTPDYLDRPSLPAGIQTTTLLGGTTVGDLVPFAPGGPNPVLLAPMLQDPECPDCERRRKAGAVGPKSFWDLGNWADFLDVLWNGIHVHRGPRPAPAPGGPTDPKTPVQGGGGGAPGSPAPPNSPFSGASPPTPDPGTGKEGGIEGGEEKPKDGPKETPEYWPLTDFLELYLPWLARPR